MNEDDVTRMQAAMLEIREQTVMIMSLSPDDLRATLKYIEETAREALQDALV